VKYGDVVNLAWDLADAVAPTLSPEVRAEMFAALGAGDIDETLSTLLRECSSVRTRFAEALLVRLREWIVKFVDPSDELRRLAVVHYILSSPVSSPLPAAARPRDDGDRRRRRVALTAGIGVRR
jgi:hypothetical protein